MKLYLPYRKLFQVMKDYYETNSVGAGRSSYSCECCGKSIPKGTGADVHKFYPDFASRRTHKKCSAKFLAGEYCSECGEWAAKEDISDYKKDHEEYSCCKTCFEENRGVFTAEKIGVV